VWKALTDPAALEKWLLPNNFTPDVGRPFQFVSLDGENKIFCMVLEATPEQKLSFTWQDGEDEPPSVVSWSLDPDDSGGTRLTVEHQILEPAAAYVLIEAGANWESLLLEPLPLVLHALAGGGRTPIPIVYVEEIVETPSKRIAGLTRRIEEIEHVGPTEVATR
jgi:uncharacterized protein YndB with AHSA1/START domain